MHPRNACVHLQPHAPAPCGACTHTAFPQLKSPRPPYKPHSLLLPPLLPRARLGLAVQKPALRSNAQGFEGQGKLLVHATCKGKASCPGGDISLQTKRPPR